MVTTKGQHIAGRSAGCIILKLPGRNVLRNQGMHIPLDVGFFQNGQFLKIIQGLDVSRGDAKFLKIDR